MSAYRVFAEIFIKVSLLGALSAQLLAQAPSSRDILERFCQLDAEGEQLNTGGCERVAALFVVPGPPRHESIVVVKDFVVSRPVVEKDGDEFYVEYIQLGRIDLSRALFSALPSMKVRAGFSLVRQSPSGAGGSGAIAEWRIAGPMPEPHLTVEAAIRYATDLRAHAKKAPIRKNADRMLAALSWLR
jgi:hypothetical protein